MGKLVPIGLLEVLPGDTIQQSTSLLVRMSPLLAPVMHPVSVRVHHWFVPNRIIWSDWEDFITGGSDGLGAGTPYPTNESPWTVTIGSVQDYLGVPLGGPYPIGTLSWLPIRAYNRIFDEFYRDEDLLTENPFQSTVRRIAWEKDYFTSARPWSQKGPAVTLPIGAAAPVKTSTNVQVSGVQAAMSMRVGTTGGAPASGDAGIVGTTGVFELRTPTSGSAAGGLYPNNLYADLTNATPADIIDVRRAFALQRYQEARAQYGSRYTEYLRYLGINPQDARLQRPEYLGGGKQTVAFSEVLRTGNNSAATPSPIGEMKGHGIAAMRSNRYRYFVQEHGYIMSLLSVRPRSMYTNGLDRTWSRRTKEDYYQKELELIGQQEVYNREVFLKGDASDGAVFGYQDRYSEYRYEYSSVAAEFRNLLDYWHLARRFTDTPTLNQSFIECDPTKRIFAEQTQNSMWIMASHNIQARRMVGNQTIGRVI